jgi:hypothetical protein
MAFAKPLHMSEMNRVHNPTPHFFETYVNISFTSVHVQSIQHGDISCSINMFFHFLAVSPFLWIILSCWRYSPFVIWTDLTLINERKNLIHAASFNFSSFLLLVIYPLPHWWYTSQSVTSSNSSYLIYCPQILPRNTLVAPFLVDLISAK